MREYRRRLKGVIPKDHFDHCPYIDPALDRTISSVIPKLPWYAGAGDHFGEVRSKDYAEQFFTNLFAERL